VVQRERLAIGVDHLHGPPARDAADPSEFMIELSHEDAKTAVGTFTRTAVVERSISTPLSGPSTPRSSEQVRFF
jgi:hypothetical protein